MPFEIKFTDDGGVVIKGSGVLTDEDLIELNKTIYKDDKQIKNISYQICDYSNCQKVDLTSDAIKRAAEMDEKAFSINPKMRIAVLGETDIVYGLGRMWEIFACEMSGRESNCRIFRERDDIVKWIESEKKKS